MYSAARDGKIDVVDEAIIRGADVKWKNSKGK